LDRNRLRTGLGADLRGGGGACLECPRRAHRGARAKPRCSWAVRGDRDRAAPARRLDPAPGLHRGRALWRDLLGGFTSGEDQAGLLAQQAALHSDALLRLCVDLYSEALADPSPDARYLRLWSVLETLSGARLPSGQPVQRLDGTAWPDHPGTTSVAAARVYRLIADHLQSRSVDEPSFVSPASDLYEAVRAWYARRNATGHYGRFVVGDPRQVARGWYERAQQTVAAAGAPEAWLMTFQQATASVLQWELMAVEDTRSRD
jgi:hypothetical protein